MAFQSENTLRRTLFARYDKGDGGVEEIEYAEFCEKGAMAPNTEPADVDHFAR